MDQLGIVQVFNDYSELWGEDLQAPGTYFKCLNFGSQWGANAFLAWCMDGVPLSRSAWTIGMRSGDAQAEVGRVSLRVCDRGRWVWE